MVVVGFLILAGAVNTAIIGSNGVLNRVAEDGVLPDWFLKPHPHYGTTYRLLYLILGLQLFTIVVSRGERAGCWARPTPSAWSGASSSRRWPWSCCASRTPGPASSRCRSTSASAATRCPIGLGLIFLILLVSAVMNLLTKETATEWGLGFTAGFMTLFLAAERYNRRQAAGDQHEHLEQFNQAAAGGDARRRWG